MNTATSTNNTELENKFIESTEIALDLTLAFLDEAPARAPIEKELPTKSQRDCQTEFNLMAKKFPDDNIIVHEEAQSSLVKPSMVQIPQYSLRDSALGENNSIDEIMRSMALEPIFEDVSAVIHGEPIDELGILNTSNLKEKVHTSLVQKALNKVQERNKENQLSNIVNVNEVFSTNDGLSDFALGPNGKIRWKGILSATRSLLDVMFDRETLATHTLSAHSLGSLQDRICPLKGQFLKVKVKDLIYILKQKFDCSEGRIRKIISQNCGVMNYLLSKLF
ncbi:PREDICTED: uncharacterized protein LOC108970158 [Bactrocera latifrons]|uniref:BEN domain-containing protein n=1 Tax=Bactrocera latifrons TaxID=174628 RepID=A0A0K8UF93_BACLA|nr:PREDICTED: uncharacterized protein LOC108970158 [Bactrocera latifrons]